MDASVNAAVVAIVCCAFPVRAEWDIANGHWSKSHAHDLRVMTWNVRDTIRSTATKSEGQNAWTACARIVASLQPDVLLLQETGDNVFGVDTVANLATTVELFLHGGNDPFFAGAPPVTAYVAKYAPPFEAIDVFIGEQTDGFNRNVIISRYPFADLNGDGSIAMSDIPVVQADLYAPGGGGGIRGFQFAEIDLPDVPFRGDVVFGNAHLKAGGNASDFAQRLRAAQNVAYVIDYWFNGADVGIPDPRDRILDQPQATNILDAFTPVIIGGDWNQEPLPASPHGPAEWLTQTELENGTDGADRDRTDAARDHAFHLFSGSPATLDDRKFDYIAWQDSIVTPRRTFVFDTEDTPTFALPNELDGFLAPAEASAFASDHRPVVVDLQPAIVHDADRNQTLDLIDFISFEACTTAPGGEAGPECLIHDADRDNDVDLLDFTSLQWMFDDIAN